MFLASGGLHRTVIKIKEFKLNDLSPSTQISVTFIKNLVRKLVLIYTPSDFPAVTYIRLTESHTFSTLSHSIHCLFLK
jgi:hypothetical protein